MPKLLFIVFLSFIGVIGDTLLKAAGTGFKIRAGLFIAGVLIYSSTAIGWYFALKHVKMTEVGSVYGVSTILMLTAVSYFIFNEAMGMREVLGILAGILSIVLLARFA